jgi:hypothetical protein
MVPNPNPEDLNHVKSITTDGPQSLQSTNLQESFWLLIYCFRLNSINSPRFFINKSPKTSQNPMDIVMKWIKTTKWWERNLCYKVFLQVFVLVYPQNKWKNGQQFARKKGDRGFWSCTSCSESGLTSRHVLHWMPGTWCSLWCPGQSSHLRRLKHHKSLYSHVGSNIQTTWHQMNASKDKLNPRKSHITVHMVQMSPKQTNSDITMHTTYSRCT